MNNLFRIIYCSRNNIPGSPDAVAAGVGAILQASRRNNARDGVSGGLLFSRNSFAQVLEGPVDAVEAVFERIQCDERHSEVSVVQSGPITTRDFPEWSMAYSGAARKDCLVAGMLIDNAFSSQSGDGEALLDLLKGIVHREREWLAPAASRAMCA